MCLKPFPSHPQVFSVFSPLKKGENMNKRLLGAALAAVLILTALSGCSLFFPEDNELEGTWDAGYGGTVTFHGSSWAADNSGDTWDYSGTIIKFDNDSFNTPSENPSTGTFGSILVKITYHTGDSTQIGTYTVIRWKNRSESGGTVTVETSEGYKSGTSFTSADEAWAGVTAAAGFFDYGFSTLTLIP